MKLLKVQGKDVKLDKDMLDSRNFQNTCPQQLSSLPTKECTLGKVTYDKDYMAKGCDWAVNSEEHCFCFWKLMHDESTVDGITNTYSKRDCAKLLGMTESRVGQVHDNALKKLKNIKKLDEF